MHIRRYVFAAFLAASVFSASLARADELTGTATLRANQWTKYCQYFHDPLNNNGWSSCAAAGTKPNADIDVEGVLLAPTIPLHDPDTYVAIRTMLQYLVQPEPKPRLADSAFGAISPRERVLWQRHVSGVRSMAYDTVANIVGRRMPVGPATPDLTYVWPAWTPLLPPNAVVPPDPSAPAIPGNVNLARFDTAIGDGLAYVLQREGNLDGGQCADNGNQSCGFYRCQPAMNTSGATCIGRPASAVTQTINILPVEMIRDRHILLSSGLMHEAGDCAASGTSPALDAQLDALKARGAIGIVVVGVYNGRTLGENPVDLAPINTCIQQTISNRSDGTIAFAGGFDNSSDHMIPTEPYATPLPWLSANYYTNAWLNLLSTGVAPSTTNSDSAIAGITSCKDGTPPPCTAP